MKIILLVLTLMAILACSGKSDVSGGTANEGETSIHGVVTLNEKNAVQAEIKLYRVDLKAHGQKMTLVDSTLSDSTGKFSFEIKEKNENWSVVAEQNELADYELFKVELDSKSISLDLKAPTNYAFRAINHFESAFVLGWPESFELDSSKVHSINLPVKNQTLGLVNEKAVYLIDLTPLKVLDTLYLRDMAVSQKSYLNGEFELEEALAYKQISLVNYEEDVLWYQNHNFEQVEYLGLFNDNTQTLKMDSEPDHLISVSLTPKWKFSFEVSFSDVYFIGLSEPQITDSIQALLNQSAKILNQNSLDTVIEFELKTNQGYSGSEKTHLDTKAKASDFHLVLSEASFTLRENLPYGIFHLAKQNGLESWSKVEITRWIARAFAESRGASFVDLELLPLANNSFIQKEFIPPVGLMNTTSDSDVLLKFHKQLINLHGNTKYDTLVKPLLPDSLEFTQEGISSLNLSVEFIKVLDSTMSYINLYQPTLLGVLPKVSVGEALIGDGGVQNYFIHGYSGSMDSYYSWLSLNELREWKYNNPDKPYKVSLALYVP
jgi:hypothetical protein